MREELSKVFALNYHALQHSFEVPLECAFLQKEEILELLETNANSESTMNFYGLNFTREEQKKLILQKLNKKAEEHKKSEYWETLLRNFGLQLLDTWTFEGDAATWTQFIKNRILSREKAIILNPLIEVQIENFYRPIQLQPAAIVYYKQSFTLLLQTHSKNTGKSFFGAFIFYDYFFRNFLSIEFSETALFHVVNNGEINYYFTLPLIMKPNSLTSAAANYCPIYKALGLSKPHFQSSIFSEFLTEAEWEHLFYTVDTNAIKGGSDSEIEFIANLNSFKTKIVPRLKKLDDLAQRMECSLPDKLEVSNWYKCLDWGNFLSINSLKTHYLETRNSKLFPIEGKLFKAGISLLFPKYPILRSPLIDIRKAFSILEKLEDQLSSKGEDSPNFENFLSFIFGTRNSKKIKREN
ncbi:hypothetical protein [Candidatus Mycoplasma haematominutum]|uniref:Uncharacterized protein n=1 Tax=Candidatus Mycoplasma haematominutum 'Birmingham 1' TaxID=1116213 RepID=G8C390_9MOLU|nr:hypothetical protein [Candidatus Mycoplasma haematominutum]CCE66788.1 hypothetical protein (homolog to MSU_0499) [Candidatus Mycoplasma haematominutum 'Birmingham 1']